jgi:hypothetical protein
MLSADLLYLPEQLRKVKPQVIDVYLCWMMLNEKESEWDKEVTNMMSVWIQSTVDEGRYISGQVKMIN